MLEIDGEGVTTMEQATCESCVHFHQHYALDQKHIFRVYCGHCVLAKAARKRPDTKACENYKPGEPDEAAFASKEYLSKELLQYMMKLELLPEIKNAQEGTT